MTIVGRFCVELRADTEEELRVQLRVIRGAIIQTDRDCGYGISVTSPELSRDDPTSFHARTYLRPVVTAAPQGQNPPWLTHWRKS